MGKSVKEITVSKEITISDDMFKDNVRPKSKWDLELEKEEQEQRRLKRVEQDDEEHYQWLLSSMTDFEVQKIRSHEIFDMKQNGEYEEEFDRKIKKLDRILVTVTDARARDLIILKILEIEEAPIEHAQGLKQIKDLKEEFRIFKEMGNRRKLV